MGKIFGSRSIHLKLASLLIAFIADDIRYYESVVFTAGADNYWGGSKSGSTSEQYYVWTKFLRNEA